MFWFTLKVTYWMLHLKVYALLAETLSGYKAWIDVASMENLGIVASGTFTTNG